MYNKFMLKSGSYDVFLSTAQNLIRVKDIIVHDSLIEELYSSGSRGSSGGSLEPPSLPLIFEYPIKMK